MSKKRHFFFFSLCVTIANVGWIRGIQGTCMGCEDAYAHSSSVDS